jgi:hypothetical protein
MSLLKWDRSKNEQRQKWATPEMGAADGFAKKGTAIRSGNDSL